MSRSDATRQAAKRNTNVKGDACAMKGALRFMALPSRMLPGCRQMCLNTWGGQRPDVGVPRAPALVHERKRTTFRTSTLPYRYQGALVWTEGGPDLRCMAAPAKGTHCGGRRHDNAPEVRNASHDGSVPLGRNGRVVASRAPCEPARWATRE